MKVLVIGSKGFIGSHLYSCLRALETYESWACDVVAEYTDEKYFVLDASNSDFNEIFETVTFDVCINCSGAASVPDSLLHPARDFTLNTNNVLKILEAIRKNCPSCKVINLSSAAIYGNPERIPVSEDSKINPMSPYGVHKFLSEQILTEYYKFFNIQCCSLRIFSAYGPGLKKQLLWDIAQKSKQGKVALYGTGDETRDFIFIEDVVSGILTVMINGDFEAGLYNLASGTQSSVKKVALELLNQLQYKGDVKFSSEKRVGDPSKWQADITKIKNIGFDPKYDLKTGINSYVKWLRNERLV